MQKLQLLNRRNIGTIGAICGSLLISIPISSIAQTTPSRALNPTPSIFKEPPYNRNSTPQPSAITPTSPIQQNYPVQPPLPEQQQKAIAIVTPVGGKVDVRLKNNTNAVIAYEAIEYTNRRVLPAKGEIVLRGLPAPVTITLVRQDNGFIQIIPASSSSSGMLDISLSEAPSLNEQQGTIRIQQNGNVFVN
ncbi:hypothetical protein [Aliterella atlantica]|uniref:Uncharacterized protein n=1 Tax=Aliterella atlantica CENA595 TaxID=1618023 RepID=A0A0D8ZUR2_9CYAN|nr:hypothetical protein [Aliterella atlantica]KJH70981.1 hypothetical protein UH38_15490 [Aliterella atlantica CENA595]